MSNQPKITYRSDSTGSNYMMMLGDKSFRIIYECRSGAMGGISPLYACQFPWRLTINRFFDIITAHINTGEWMP